MLPKLIFFSFFIFLLHLTASAQFNRKLKYGKVKDIDGNKYKTIKIGTQTWMAENLRTTKYRNGTAITNIIYDTIWCKDTIGAWCYYFNNEKTNKKLGKLYNWFAVINSNQICPTGWHVPSDEEWTILINYLDPLANGNENIAGGKMMSTSVMPFSNQSVLNNNQSGFSGLMGGFRESAGYFSNANKRGYWWSSTDMHTCCACGRVMDHNFSVIEKACFSKREGWSVRCVKD